MRIAIDGRSLEEAKRTGVARYLGSLLEEMVILEPQNDYFVLFQEKEAKDRFLLEDCVHKELVRASLPPRKKVPWEQIWLPRSLTRIKPDLLFSPSYSTPIFSATRSVVTIHDVTYEVNPRWFGPKERIKMRSLTRMAARRAQHIIAVSQSSKKDLVSFYGIAPDKISVIYEAASREFEPTLSNTNDVREKHGLSGDFFLYVGSFFSRRNLPVLLEAFESVLREHPEVKLMLIGENRAYPPLELEKTLVQKNLRRSVDCVEYVTEDDLIALYSSAVAFVYPSSYEGFGLPVLEAMSCGTPVITGDASSLPEVVGDAGILVDPVNSGALASAMSRVLDDQVLRRELVRRGLERAKLFSWRIAAQETLEVFKRVASER